MFYAGYEDMHRRKITTVTFLLLDAGLLIYYLLFDFWIALFLIPLLAEYFFKQYSLLFYVILALPLFFDLSTVTISIAYSVFLIKMFGTLVKNFGRGDVKVLQAIAVAVPIYPHVPLTDSLFPPVLAVILVASILGTIASLLKTPRKDQVVSVRDFSLHSPQSSKEIDKFWVQGSKKVYKIPLVTFIAVGFTLLFILSLLQLV